MEFGRNLENYALSSVAVGNFLSELEPHEFDILWDLTDPELTLAQIAERNGFSKSQVNTIRGSLVRKAEAFLGQ